MENHPIPQNVTGFQFKLIGNMTVKQFAYLATGIVTGWIFLQVPLSIFIKFPLGVFFAILGIGLAFFPISGRPMDAMIGNFIKALLRPTQFVYEKTGRQLYFPKTGVSFSTSKQYVESNLLPFQQKDKLKAYLETQLMQESKIDEKENNFLVSASSLTNNALTPNISPALNIPKPIGDMPQIKPTPLPIPIVEPPAQKPISPLPKNFNRNIGLPNAPDTPNLIIGITKDARGNVLSNILIEIKDKEGNPVRAFKTNEFGRFASATPLINGSYTIEFEDPKEQNRFEKRIVNATGQIIQPIETMSIDTREELRRSLFSPPAGGSNN